MAVDAKRLEIRDSFKARAIGTVGGCLMRLIAATLRFEIVDQAGLMRDQKPVVYALWHEDIFVVPAAWRKQYGRIRRAVILTSASHDGAAVARAMSLFRLGSVRGSTSRRAVAALVAMKKALREGYDVCVTPDGPRGPRRVLQAGLVKLAQSAGSPVIPIHLTYGSCWRLNTWDKFAIPKPFSRVRVVFGSALGISPGLSDDAFEAERAHIESIMRKDAVLESEISQTP
jgi:lysophospholipid acyltransferase (LPLAT)-like uncharacterized protein